MMGSGLAGNGSQATGLGCSGRAPRRSGSKIKEWLPFWHFTHNLRRKKAAIFKKGRHLAVILFMGKLVKFSVFFYLLFWTLTYPVC
jgi:hypothetical protein